MDIGEHKQLAQRLKDENFADIMLLAELKGLKSRADKDANHVYLTRALLDSVRGYFSLKSYQTQKEEDFEIYDLLRFLVGLAESKTLKHGYETYEKNMATGQFVEVLKESGISRLSAIKVTAKLLNKGESTVRIANENFKKFFHGPYRRFITFSYSQDILERAKLELLQSPKITNSKKALEKTIEFYDCRDEQMNRMFLEFKEIDN